MWGPFPITKLQGFPIILGLVKRIHGITLDAPLTIPILPPLLVLPALWLKKEGRQRFCWRAFETDDLWCRWVLIVLSSYAGIVYFYRMSFWESCVWGGGTDLIEWMNEMKSIPSHCQVRDFSPRWQMSPLRLILDSASLSGERQLQHQGKTLRKIC